MDLAAQVVTVTKDLLGGIVVCESLAPADETGRDVVVSGVELEAHAECLKDHMTEHWRASMAWFTELEA